MKVKKLFVVAAVILALPILCRPARAQGTAFTYQGQLNAGGVAANGNYDFQFGLYTNVSTGSLIGSLETNAATGVTNGVFTTTLNLGNVFNGTAYWLGIGVRSNGTTNAFTLLTPRQPITPTPYAITASNLTGPLAASQLTGAIPASAVSGTFSNSVSFTNTTNVFVGNGSGLTGVPGVTANNYLYVYDTTIQDFALANTWQSITISTISSDAGWSVPASGEFVAQQSGLYLVTYQAHIANSSATTVLAAGMRAIGNITTSPFEFVSSESLIYVPAQSAQLVSRSFLVSFSAGEMISLQVAGTSTTGYLYSLPSSEALFDQSFPSVTLTIVRIQ